MKLALDHHFSPAIAARLRERDHDAVAAIERGWATLDDEELLDVCRCEHRVLLTNDVADFVVLARRWSLEGRSHAGLVFTPDAGLPRSRPTIGRFVEALERLMVAHPDDRTFTHRILWL